MTRRAILVDIVEEIKGSIIQHGAHNNRIYLMRLNTDDTRGLIATLDDLALKNGYGKILAKIPASSWSAFKSADYVKEAVVPGFFKGKTDGFFIAKYFSDRRQRAQNVEQALRLVKQAGEESANKRHRTGIAKRKVVPCKHSDAAEMSLIYQQVFKTYPFPIQKKKYLECKMKEGVLYFCIRIEGRLAAISAAEIDLVSKSAEMTDFATCPKRRGMGFARLLLSHMEKVICKLGIKTAYNPVYFPHSFISIHARQKIFF